MWLCVQGPRRALSARTSGVRGSTRPAGPRTPHRCSGPGAGRRRLPGRAPPRGPRALWARTAHRTSGSFHPSADCGCPECPEESSPNGPDRSQSRRSAHGRGRRKPGRPARLPGSPGHRSRQGAADASRTGGRGRERPAHGAQASTASPPQSPRVRRVTTGSHDWNPEVLGALDSASTLFLPTWLLRRRGSCLRLEGEGCLLGLVPEDAMCVLYFQGCHARCSSPG